jgi:hypothetical protein
MMMTDSMTAKMLFHSRNIQRYRRMLATEMTDLERQYIHKRIADEQAQLGRFAEQHSTPSPGADACMILGASRLPSGQAAQSDLS